MHSSEKGSLTFPRRVDEIEAHGTLIPVVEETGGQKIYLNAYQKCPLDWLTELTEGPLLDRCRTELEKAGRSCVLGDSGAKIFVRPDQWTKVTDLAWDTSVWAMPVPVHRYTVAVCRYFAYRYETYRSSFSAFARTLTLVFLISSSTREK